MCAMREAFPQVVVCLGQTTCSPQVQCFILRQRADDRRRKSRGNHAMLYDRRETGNLCLSWYQPGLETRRTQLHPTERSRRLPLPRQGQTIRYHALSESEVRQARCSLPRPLAHTRRPSFPCRVRYETHVQLQCT
ncbi:hypothetical protein LY76DRAFT_195034 [Colletotrichum caudatum]|nr:hypothetical protein LY76DRAFT_195034 [Colletotrichum caudatum]